jgi:hypothetical protein
MQNIVYLILNDGAPLAANERISKVFPHLEEVGSDFVSNREPLNGWFRLIKTHFPYGMTPQNKTAKYIFIARNPMDCVVSFYHHTRGFGRHYNFENGKWDTYFNLFLQGKVDFGDYFTCLRSWMDHKDDPNVLFLTYERIRADTRGAILEISTFLDSERLPPKLLANDEEILNLVLEHSSLKNMKKHPLRWSSERPKEHTPFIRKGSIGEWDELLREEQAAMLQKRLNESFSPSELEFLGSQYTPLATKV